LQPIIEELYERIGGFNEEKMSFMEYFYLWKGRNGSMESSRRFCEITYFLLINKSKETVGMNLLLHNFLTPKDLYSPFFLI